MRFLILVVLLFLLGCSQGKHEEIKLVEKIDQDQLPDRHNYTIVGGKGIDSVALLGDDISGVDQVWGKRPIGVSDDLAVGGRDQALYSLNYTRQGVIIRCNAEGNIKEIRCYDFARFDGRTRNGLTLHSTLKGIP
jgi:hypothetical protein